MAQQRAEQEGSVMGRRSTRPGAIPRLRERKRGKVTYYFYDTGETPRREIPLGRSRPEALVKWAELEANNTATAAAVTMKDGILLYRQRVIPRKSPGTQVANNRELVKIEEYFCDPPAPISKVRPLHIRAYLDWRTEHGKVATTAANREKALLSHMWNRWREWGLTDAENPCKGVAGYTEAGRDVYVEDDVYGRVWDAADEPLRDALDLAYLTGQRPADTLGFDRRDVRDGFLHLGQRKTGTKLRIAVEGELAELLERIAARKRGYKLAHTALVVDERGQPLSKNQLRYRFDQAREKAKVPKGAFQFRDLRAKAGTDKAESAGDIRQAQKQLGHASVTMTEVYVRARKGDKTTPTR